MPVRSPSPARSEDGRARRDRGRRAEWLALLALSLRGYRPVARNLRTPVGEIDLVVRRGGTLAIVEVKTRGQLADAAEALRPGHQARIRRAAEFLLARRPDLAALTIRFDVMLVLPRRWPRHLVGVVS